jgi:UDP-glucose 6-dehydrogenase
MADGLRLSVLGAGHLGVTHAVCMAAAGFEVVCADVDADRVARLRAGEALIFEPGLGECGTVAGKPVCILGAAFKPGSDDVRDSPALDVAQILHGLGADVTVHDPHAIPRARRACPQLSYATTIPAAAAGAELTLLLTDWPEYAAINPAELATHTAQPHIIDGRHQLNPATWRAAGWHYHATGTPHPAQTSQPT